MSRTPRPVSITSPALDPLGRLPNATNPSPLSTPYSPAPSDPLRTFASSPAAGGGSPAPSYTASMGHGEGILSPASGGGSPISPPAPVRPMMADPKVKSINDREESEHQLEIERARRRKERDELAASKQRASEEGAARAKERNLAGAASRKAEGMKNRPQNFNPDGSPKSPQQRVSTGTANDTDKLMALEGPEREAAFAKERAKGQQPRQIAQTAYTSALERLNREARMRKMGLRPGNAADEARFNDLLRLATH